jgi:cytochrome P450
MKYDILNQIRDIKATENTDKWQLDVSHPTIFHDLLSSKILPEKEKLPSRLAQDGQILVQAGTLTSSWSLSIATFHLISNPPLLRQLRDELFKAMPDRDAVISLVQLEQLPFLRGCVKEALRLGLGSSSRLARSAPDETLQFHDKETGITWYIPPGTPVGMTTYRTQMDEKIYYDPFRFHPERWINDGERLEKYFTVFSGGNRACLGMALAQAELHLTLAKLFRRWGGAGYVGGNGEVDSRPGDLGLIRLYETTVKDCEMAADYFIPIPYRVCITHTPYSSYTRHLR